MNSGSRIHLRDCDLPSARRYPTRLRASWMSWLCLVTMPKRFDLVVFDWDGTLIDSAGAIVASIQAACRDLRLPVPDNERASHVIGLGLQDALSHAIPGLPPTEYP